MKDFPPSSSRLLYQKSHALGSVLNEKLDPINNAVFFPIFCALHGMKTNIPGLTTGSHVVEIILLAVYVGKFFGITFITSLISRFNFSHSIAIALMSSKGLMDIALIGVWRERPVIFPPVELVLR